MNQTDVKISINMQKPCDGSKRLKLILFQRKLNKGKLQYPMYTSPLKRELHMQTKFLREWNQGNYPSFKVKIAVWTASSSSISSVYLQRIPGVKITKTC